MSSRANRRICKYDTGVASRQRRGLSYDRDRAPKPISRWRRRRGVQTINNEDVRAEILRLRDRQHELEKQLWGVVAVGKELARGLGELRDDVHLIAVSHGELEELVDTMTKREQLEQSVAAAIRQERRELLTWPRKLAAVGLALVLAVPAAHELALIVAGL